VSKLAEKLLAQEQNARIAWSYKSTSSISFLPKSKWNYTYRLGYVIINAF